MKRRRPVLSPAEDRAYRAGYSAGYSAARRTPAKPAAKPAAKPVAKPRFEQCWGCVSRSVCPFETECARWLIEADAAIAQPSPPSHPEVSP